MIDEAKLADALSEARLTGRRVYLVGNGGSAANAQHVANDLFSAGLRALALTADISTFSAIANDYGYEHVFSRQLKIFAEEEDVLIAFSGSGKSPNILRAIDTAETIGMHVFLVTDYLQGRTMQQSEEYQVGLGHRLMKHLKENV